MRWGGVACVVSWGWDAPYIESRGVRHSGW